LFLDLVYLTPSCLGIFKIDSGFKNYRFLSK
jgi:hypothetical protein